MSAKGFIINGDQKWYISALKRKDIFVFVRFHKIMLIIINHLNI